jgi:hypothetical protein
VIPGPFDAAAAYQWPKKSRSIPGPDIGTASRQIVALMRDLSESQGISVGAIVVALGRILTGLPQGERAAIREAEADQRARHVDMVLYGPERGDE